jgi:hypothetical protein
MTDANSGGGADNAANIAVAEAMQKVASDAARKVAEDTVRRSMDDLAMRAANEGNISPAL